MAHAYSQAANAAWLTCFYLAGFCAEIVDNRGCKLGLLSTSIVVFVVQLVSSSMSA